jgi:hypothetical protein
MFNWMITTLASPVILQPSRRAPAARFKRKIKGFGKADLGTNYVRSGSVILERDALVFVIGAVRPAHGCNGAVLQIQ